MAGDVVATLKMGLDITGAVPMWAGIVADAMKMAEKLLPPGSRVVEVGYGDGCLTCHLAQSYGWIIQGYDISREAYETAVRHAAKFGVADRVSFNMITSDEMWKVKGQFDGVFIKTVLYNARDLDEYGRWLDWVVSVLKPGGTFVNFENGKTGPLMHCYRRLAGKEYINLSLYDGLIQELYASRFRGPYFRHYGGYSQYFAKLAPLYRLAAGVEDRIYTRTPDNSYITAIIAKKD